MKIPCVERLPFIVSGLAFLQPALTTITPDTKECNDLGRNFQLVSVYSESMLD